ncbi:MAG: disulfide bond formation protein B [Acidimicrobiales bacterium]|nr:disulfide bond formation protein B [Acidimicrobiales bacterium]
MNDVAALTATLALLANAATILLVVGLLAGPRSVTLDRFVWWTRDRALPLIAVVALASTLGSLYYSEIAHFEPCRYCWFQRIAMYPIVVVAGVAALRREGSARLTVAVLAGTGLLVSTWHWLIQHNPDWASEASCSLTAPCTSAYVEEFGFVTIPWMAGSGFVLILALAALPTILREGTPR